MLEQLAERVPGANVTLRINPGVGHGHSQKTNTGGEGSKHGIWHEAIPDVLQRAEWAGLAVTGLHMHIGSGADLIRLAAVAESLEKTAHDIGRSLTTISAGEDFRSLIRKMSAELTCRGTSSYGMPPESVSKIPLVIEFDSRLSPGGT